MQVAVWDTYVKIKSGSVLHFDIIAPKEIKDTGVIYNFGMQHLRALGEHDHQLSTNECQFCHIEEPTAEMLTAIQEKGYYILEMDTIPPLLEIDASRRDKIMYLKGHYFQHRFRSFREIQEDEIDQMLLNTEK